MGLFDFLKKKEQYVTNIQPVPTIQTQDATVREAAVKPGNTTVETININPKTVAMLHRSFIAFDVETTGLSPESDRIIELGAVRFEDGKPVEEFNTLVNPRISIPKTVTTINHITNDMIAVAPDEKEVYAKLLDFFGDAVSKKTIMCAHNASFDFRFLANTLIRLGYDGKFLYTDTLNLSRKYIKGLDNYKQGTIEKHLGLFNDNAHRAASDAKICGEILCNILMNLDEEINEQRRNMEKCTPLDEELEICGYVQRIINNSCEDISWLRYRRNSSNYVDVTCLYTVFKFKVSKKGNYLIADKKDVAHIELFQEACTESEGGHEYVRVFFNELSNLDQLASYITKLYKDTYSSMRSYVSNGERAKKSAEEGIAMMTQIESDEMERLILSAEERIKIKQIMEQEKQKTLDEKQKEKQEKKRIKELVKIEAAATKKNTSDVVKKAGREIIQLDDNGTVIKIYETIALAVRETNINSKSIRDAAKGVQKHAGGFCWKYNDEVEEHLK